MMPNHSLADALPDFASLPQPLPEERRAAARESAKPLQPAIEERTLKDMIAAEVARTRAEADQEWQARHESELARERERHDAEITELAARSGAEAARLIDRRFAELEAQLVEITTSVAARILGASLADDIRKRAVAQLTDTIRAALSDGEAVRVRVRGAPSLCETLEKSLGSHADQVEFQVSDRFDLTVDIDDSIFETRLSEWSAAMSEAFS